MKSQIDQEFVLSIIEKKFPNANYTVINYTLEGINEETRTGFLGDYATLRVMVQSETESNKLVQFFIKFCPKLPSLVQFAEELGAYEKEYVIYDIFDRFRKEKINLIDMCSSLCYYRDPKKCFVMDHLIVEGFKTVNKMRTLNYDEVVVILTSLAKLHASSLIYEEYQSRKTTKNVRLNEEFTIPESYFMDDPKTIMNISINACITGLQNCIDIFNFPKTLYSGKNFKTVLKDVCSNIYKLVKPSEKYRNTVCHGDLWATNFLMKYDDTSTPLACKFVDFQCGRYVPPSYDVMSLLHLTTSREFRQKHLYNLIGLYHSYLEKLLNGAGLQGKTILGFDQFWESCNDAKCFAIIQSAVYIPLILLSSKDAMRYFADEKMYQKAFLEDRSVLILDHMDDEVYIQRIRETIEDFKDFCDYL